MPVCVGRDPEYVLFSAVLHVAVALNRTRVDLRSAGSFMTCDTLPRVCIISYGYGAIGRSGRV